MGIYQHAKQVIDLKIGMKGAKTFTVSYQGESGAFHIIYVDANAFSYNHTIVGEVLGCSIYGEDCYVFMQ